METSPFQAFGNVCTDIVPCVDAPCTHYIRPGFCTLENHFRCPEYILRNEPPLSYTALKTYTTCHRKFWWEWYRGYTKKEKGWALQLGSHASNILGVLHHRDRAADCVEWFNHYIDTAIGKTTDSGDSELEHGHHDLWIMKAMFDAYIEKEFHTLKGVTEYEFRWDIPDYPKVHGFVDLVDLNTHEDTQGYEFKWSKNPDNYERFLIEDQLTAYFIGVPQLKRMTVRVFVPPLQRLKKGETITEFYGRVKADIKRRSTTQYFISNTYWREEFNLDDYKIRARECAREIMNYLEQGTQDPFVQNKQSCLSPFRCDFLEICKFKTISEDIYLKRTPHK